MMDQTPFKIECDRSGSHLTLYVEGELDALTAPELIETFAGESRRPADLVWIDLAGLTFCNSSGLVAIQRVSEAAIASGAICKIVDPSPMVDRILSLTGLDQVISTYRTQSVSA